MASWSLALWASTVALSACAGQAPPTDAPVATDARPRRLEELLPITDRTVSSFRTRDDLGETGLVVFEYYRPRPGLGEIEIAGRIQRLYLHPDAVEHATGGFLLREPLEPGRTFQGTFAQVRIDRVDAVIEVPAGRFSGCVVTVEETPNPPRRLETTFCPKVGLTRMVVEGDGDDGVLSLTTELLGYGPREDLSSPQNP